MNRRMRYYYKHRDKFLTVKNEIQCAECYTYFMPPTCRSKFCSRKCYCKNRNDQNKAYRKERYHQVYKPARKANDFYLKNKDAVNTWRRNNGERISEKAKLRSKNLTDGYVRSLLVRSGVRNPEKEIILIKREQIKLNRMIHEKQRSVNNY